MGLIISHDAFDGAYGAFNRFRKAICEATGGHWCDDVSGQDKWLFGDGLNSETNPGLYEFLRHSDCDGDILPEVARHIANELTSLLPKLDEVGMGVGHLARDGGVGMVARKLIAGCLRASEAGEPLRFR